MKDTLSVSIEMTTNSPPVTQYVLRFPGSRVIDKLECEFGFGASEAEVGSYDGLARELSHRFELLLDPGNRMMRLARVEDIDELQPHGKVRRRRKRSTR